MENVKGNNWTSILVECEGTMEVTGKRCEQVWKVTDKDIELHKACQTADGDVEEMRILCPVCKQYTVIPASKIPERMKKAVYNRYSEK